MEKQWAMYWICGKYMAMLQTIHAIIDPDGKIRLLEKMKIQGTKRALITILDDATEVSDKNLCALLSEVSLAEDWNRPEEEEAWSYLQPGQ